MAHKTTLMTVRGEDAPPTLDEAAAQLGISVSALNPEFGVILIDPANRLYAVEVDAEALPAGTGSRRPFHGPYSNPDIDIFAPGSDDEKD